MEYWRNLSGFGICHALKNPISASARGHQCFSFINPCDGSYSYHNPPSLSIDAETAEAICTAMFLNTSIILLSLIVSAASNINQLASISWPNEIVFDFNVQASSKNISRRQVSLLIK